MSSVVLGRTNKVNADNTVVVGANNGEIKSAQSAVFGYNNTVKGEKPEQLIFGSNSITENQGAIVVGTHGQAIAQDAVAIGNNTLADVQNSVALGTNSTTEETVSTDHIYINGEKYDFAGGVANSTVSIGANNKAGNGSVQNYKRTLTNVAAGRIDGTSTDAINGSQLNAVINALKFTTVAEGTNTTVTQSTNIDGGKEFAVHVNKDLTNMNSVQFNNGVAINNNGINAGNKTITNVAAGQNDTDSHSSMTTNKQVAVAKEVQDLKLQLSAISQKYDNLVKNLSAQKAGQDVDFEYSDLPKDHWAYDFVKKLSDKGYLNGYPDGTFKGDAKMTRYEFAAALWRAVNNGAIIDSQMAKAIKEFEPELEEVNKIMRYRIDTVAGEDNSVHKTERLRVNKNDDPFTHMKRDDYGTETYINK